MKSYLLQLVLIVLTVARLASVGAVQCDATHECPSGSTCCLMTTGEWGCCPLPEAVCCADREHCCPNGYTCRTSSGQCEKGPLTVPWLHKTAAAISRVGYASSVLRWNRDEANAVKCDARHECSTGSTCCMSASGRWACCPAPQAVCCEDKTHCCPHSYKCQTSTGRCVKRSIPLPWLRSSTFALVNIQPLEADVKCDSTHSCPSGNTCCKTSAGDWGCCPLPQAVCCKDHLHCCPKDYKCETSIGQCIKGALTLPWVNKRTDIVKTRAVQNQVASVICDETYECPTGMTCCMTDSGQWGCCPMPQAVCCPDKVHCCPHGTRCDESHGQCIKDALIVPWLHKTPALFRP